MPLDLAPRARRRLIVPAVKHAPRETLVAATPFFLRGTAMPEAAQPPLLSFEGTSFVEDFLAAVANPQALPKLLPWRDWSEPPSGVLDAAGSALYPITLKRAEPLAIEDDGLPGDGIPAGTPPWLRKLYLPLHQRFTFVAFDLVCRRLGFPPVDRARIVASGAVVRRLRPDRTCERWEDWISADGKRGVWTELALPIAQLDPQAIAAGAYAGQEVALRARLGLPADTPLPTALDSAKLALLQPDAAAGAAARHCTLYGYLPVFSSAEQAGDAVPLSPAETVSALQQRATDTVAQAALAAPTMATTINAALGDLLDATVLPAQPSSAEIANAWNTVDGFIGSGGPPAGPADQAVASALDRMLGAMLAAGFSVLAPATVDADALDADEPETAGLWLGRARDLLGTWAADGSRRTERFGSVWGAENYTANRPSWRILLDHRLRQVATAFRNGTPVPPATGGVSVGVNPEDAGMLWACVLLRLRVMRIGLAATLRRQMFGPDAETASLIAMQGGVPAGTPGALGEEIAAALGLEAWRGTPDAPTWPPLDLRTPPGTGDLRAWDAHEAARRMEDAFAAFETGVAPAGTAFDEEQNARLDARATSIAGRIGQLTGGASDPTILRVQGLEVLEQPARGLLGLPGATPTSLAIASLGISLAARYANQAVALRVARDEARVPRKRYDHDSLYAVWCWARVAGRDRCEKETIVWTLGSEPFSIAEPTDILGAKPATVQLPDIPKLIRDIPRMAKARAKPFAAFAAPPNSSYITGEEPEDTKRAWGIGWICSFGIPVLTICAFILFSIIFSILILIPGFFWMLLLKFCIPIPVPKKSS
ncbi:hypothetical protein [Falsiroseomonas bella]|uniref:hypothetical protein n=1 Tax=Falsiroseomonas bella TaxID=2184016 RepID=UPI001E546736|nr:hypothetical protein [Falsiroseomonas bella]